MIIGLAGYKGSGKSTVAQYLEREHGFKRVNFKDSLVQEMKDRLPDSLREMVQVLSSRYRQITEGILPQDNETHVITDEEMDKMVDNLFTVKPPPMRALMQNYGTEIRRRDDNNYWVNQWIDRITGIDGNIVTDDVRFENELSAIKNTGGVLIRIIRDDISSGGTHISETEQEKFIADFTIAAGEGNLDDVYRQVESILTIIKSNHD